MYNKKILSIDHPNQESKKEIVRTVKKEIVSPPPHPQTHYTECMRSFYLTSLPSTVMILPCVLIFSHRDNLHPILYWKWRYSLYTSSKPCSSLCISQLLRFFPRPQLKKICNLHANMSTLHSETGHQPLCADTPLSPKEPTATDELKSAFQTCWSSEFSFSRPDLLSRRVYLRKILLSHWT